MHKATLNLGKTKSFIGVVLFIVCGSIMIWWVAQSTDAKMKSEVLNQARTAASAISVEDLISLTASERDIGTVPYERIKEQLTSMRKAGPKTKFLYLMGKSSNGKIYFYADSLPQESEDYAFPGLVYDEVPDSYLRIFNSRREEVVGPITDRWGTLMTALVPISPQGSNKILVVLGMDIEADEWTYTVLMRCIGPALLLILLLLLVFIVASRERLMSRLKKSEESMLNILENATNLFYSHTVDHELTYVSPQSHEYLQCHPEEAMIQWTEFATDNPNNEKGFKLTQKAIETGVGQEPYELELIGKKGMKIFVEVRENPVLKEGRVVGIVGSLTDITDRKQAELALRESRREYQSTIEALLVGVVVHAADTRILLCNPEASNILELTDEQMMGKAAIDPLWRFVREDSSPMRLEDYPVNKVISTKKILRNYVLGVVHPDKEYITWANVNATPLLSSQGDIDKVIVNFINISERKQAEEERERLQNQLMQSQKMESIGNLAGGIAHDFNNILSSVLGFSELGLDEVKKGSTMEDNLQEIYAGGLRAKGIVNQILGFARQSDEEKKPTRVDVIIIEALKLIRPSTPTTIEIIEEIENSSLVMGNATQIHQIIMNLCTNAAHAMEDNGGIMEVTLKDIYFGENINIPSGLEKGKYIELVISDTGSGIEPEHIDSIFDPYFTTKETGKGTGMGLAMVRGIVETYGGTILVESSPFVKTIFTIYLPITSNLDNEITFETKTLPKGDEHILFVDDEPPIARMGSRILESLGYQVTTRTSSIEALELFKAKSDDFQLVITDMTMPHMTGDKFAIELKKIRADIPIILCTGYSNKINAEIALEIGINAFTYKPFLKADLAGCVREVLDKA